jgi:hypothetical protein
MPIPQAILARKHFGTAEACQLVRVVCGVVAVIETNLRFVHIVIMVVAVIIEDVDDRINLHLGLRKGLRWQNCQDDHEKRSRYSAPQCVDQTAIHHIFTIATEFLSKD